MPTKLESESTNGLSQDFSKIVKNSSILSEDLQSCSVSAIQELGPRM